MKCRPWSRGTIVDGSKKQQAPHSRERRHLIKPTKGGAYYFVHYHGIETSRNWMTTGIWPHVYETINSVHVRSKTVWRGPSKPGPERRDPSQSDNHRGATSEIDTIKHLQIAHMCGQMCGTCRCDKSKYTCYVWQYEDRLPTGNLFQQTSKRRQPRGTQL